MLKHSIKAIIGAAMASGVIAYSAPASADQISIGIRIGRDFALGFNADDYRHDRHYRPYAYDGFQSSYWYTHSRPIKRHRWNSRYRAYDCLSAFKFGYYNGRRARIEAVMCFDRFGNYFIVPGSRYVVAIYDGRRWGGNRRWIDDRRWDYSRRWNGERDRWSRERTRYDGDRDDRRWNDDDRRDRGWDDNDRRDRDWNDDNRRDRGRDDNDGRDRRRSEDDRNRRR